VTHPSCARASVRWPSRTGGHHRRRKIGSPGGFRPESHPRTASCACPQSRRLVRALPSGQKDAFRGEICCPEKSEALCARYVPRLVRGGARVRLRVGCGGRSCGMSRRKPCRARVCAACEGVVYSVCEGWFSKKKNKKSRRSDRRSSGRISTNSQSQALKSSLWQPSRLLARFRKAVKKEPFGEREAQGDSHEEWAGRSSVILS